LIITILSMIGKILIMIAAGLFFRKIGVISESLEKGLTNLLMDAILPINLLASAGYAFSAELSQGLLKTAAASAIYYAAGILIMVLIARHTKLESPEKKALVCMSVFQNVGFIGMPIVYELFGSEGMLYAVIVNVFYQLFFYTYGIHQYSGQGKVHLSTFYKNPLTVISILSVILYLTPFRFPEFIQGALTTIGDMTVPLSMIVIGCSLASIKPLDVLKDKHSYIVSAMRLAVFPLAALGLCWLTGLTGPVGITFVIITALPSGSMNVIMSKRYGTAPGYASRAVIQSTVLMAATLLPIILLSTWLLA